MESWLERRFLDLLRDAGLPTPQLQQRYELPGVGIARVDFEFATFPIVIEVGGRRGYLSREERQRQETSTQRAATARQTVYFFTRDDIVRQPDYVAATMFAAIKRHLGTQDCA